MISIDRNDSLATVTINNAPVNVLDVNLVNELNAFLIDLRDDRDTTMVVFRSGIEGVFVAHLDVTTINGTPAGQAGITEFSHLIDNLRRTVQLTVAVVDGVARGGGNELAMACDVTFGTENALFAQPEVNINIPTGGQGAVRLAQRLGRSRALVALLTGQDYDAKTAEALSWITAAVDSADAETIVGELAAVITLRDMSDIAMYKEIVDTTLGDERAGIECELRHFVARAGGKKTQAIISAFMKHGAQTDRELADMNGLFRDTAGEFAS
jgi:enoyl-CoA hydratase/carnithine racemase